jgi:hypothetical protein
MYEPTVREHSAGRIRSYCAPTLTVYGAMTKLTASGSKGTTEDMNLNPGQGDKRP